MAKLVELGTNVIAAKFLYHYWEMKLAEYDSVSGEYKSTPFYQLEHLRVKKFEFILSINHSTLSIKR
ncbi:hypothetical protein TEHOK1_04310 [Tetragenococcus halophilus]|nr:hypothetical protein TEHOK1_04310 [Tetragenococcus halophilus]